MASTVLELIARTFLVLAAGWLAAHALRRRSASLRATAWTFVLAAAVAMPVLSSAMPSVPVVLWEEHASAALAPQSTAVPNDVISGGPTLQGRAQSPGLKARGSEESKARSSEEGRARGSEEGKAQGSEETASSPQSLLAAIWIVGVLVVIARVAHSHIRVARLARRSDEADGIGAELAAIVEATRARLGIRRAVRIRVSDAFDVPMVTGVFRPTLVLPVEAATWPAETMQSVVLHELAHVARLDSLSQWIGHLACAAYWFVPPVWATARRAAVLREQACDDVVISSGVLPSSYAKDLLRVAQQAMGTVPTAALAMAGPDRVRERIVAVLEPGRQRAGLRSRASWAIGLFATSLAVIVATFEPTTRVVQAAMVVTHALPSASTTSTVDAPAPKSGDIAGAAETAPAATLETIPQAQTANRPCGGDLKQSSSSITDDDGVRRWKVRMSSGDCQVDLQAEGRIEFNGDFTDIASIGNGGQFRLDVTERGVRRELEIRPRSGSIERRWRVDGNERPYDDEARRWFATFLIELDRRTAIGVDTRLPALLRQGGVAAVLAETQQMYGDYARSRYYQKLLASATLTSAELVRLVTQEDMQGKSDHYSAELITAVSKQRAIDASVRSALLKLISEMDSDHYKATSIGVVVGREGTPSAADMDFLVKTIATVDSDHYKTEILETILRGQLQPSQLDELSRIARTIDSDHYAAQFLGALIARGALDTASGRESFAAGLQALQSDHYVLEVIEAAVKRDGVSKADAPLYLRALGTLESDHYRGQLVDNLLRVRDLTADDLMSVLNHAKTWKGDHYASNALVAIVKHPSANEKIRQAVLDAADGLSDHYAMTVFRAARGR